jgi:2-dehydropantoate 2-reductase
MRFVVYGAGAIGGLIGALLAEHGEDVLLIARGPHAAAIEKSGLVVESPGGQRVLRLPVAVEPGQTRPGDVVLLAMKSQDTGPALASLRQVAPPSTPIVCLQNGVENERAALRLFQNVYAVCVLCPAAHLEPGVVQSFSEPVAGLLDIGRYPSGTDVISKQVAAAFRAATFESMERSDIMRWKYRKLLMNLNNAVEAILQPPDRAGISQLVQEEGVACLQAAGLEFVSVEEDQARRGDLLKMHPVGDQPRGGGSSWQSLQRRAGSIESDYLNGEVVLLGRHHGIPTPVNALLQELAVDMARNGIQPGAMATSDFRRRLGGRQHQEGPPATG